MAKIEKTQMTVSLDNDSKRIIRDLTKAIDRLTRNMTSFEVKDATRRLREEEETPPVRAGAVPPEEVRDIAVAKFNAYR